MSHAGQKVDQLNRLPVNKLAKEILVKAKKQTDSAHLYLLQLMEWGANSQEIPAKDREILQEQVEFLKQADPKKALDLFLKDDPETEGKWVDLAQLKQLKDDPEYAALYLARQLQDLIASGQEADLD